MKIVFFGSSDFAVPNLEKLLKADYKILGVVTQPDRKKGRHLLLNKTPVKRLAMKHNLFLLQPEKLNDPEFINSLKDLNADIFVVVAYGKILTKEILALPKVFSINIHGSILPKYRGAAPINWAIINGDKTTGVSIIKMNEYMDKGDIILQKTSGIDKNDTAITLSEKLAAIGAEALIEALKLIEDKNFVFTAQNEEKVTYAPKLKKEDGVIDWKKDTRDISNQIKGLVPWPGSFTHYKGKIVKIFEAEALKTEIKGVIPGTIIDISREAICVAAGRDILRVKRLQPESGKEMTVAQFTAGHRIEKNSKFT